MANDRRNPVISESSAMRGVHGGLSPDTLPLEYIAQGANISIRGGFISTRPRFEVLGSVPLENPADFQGAGVYSLNDGDEIIFGVNGQIFAFNLQSRSTSSLYTFPSDDGQIYMTQADRYLVVQNGVDAPLFYERDNFTRPSGANELPPGYMLTYGHGRIIMVPKNVGAEEGRPYWIASDILLPLNSENVFNLTENIYWNEGGATGLPFESGFITALAVMHNAQTGTGLGALLAFGRSGVSAYQISASREDWKNLDFSQVLYTGEGTLSHHSVIPVNSDILFRSPDGIRSLKQTVSNTNGWAVYPISYEIDHRLKLDVASDLPFTYASFAQNRFLVTTAGRENGAWNGLVSMDTLVSSMLTSSSTPAYDDLWVSRPFLATVRCRIDGSPVHVVLIERNGELLFCRLSDTETKDFGTTPVTSRMYSRAYSTKAIDLLSLNFLDVIFRNIDGPLVARAYYRTDNYARWTPFDGVLEVDNQTRRKVRFSAGEGMGCREDGTPPNVGNNVQVCIEWTGVAEIEMWSIDVNPEQADPGLLAPCASYTTSLSPALDFVMVTLDDVKDLQESD